MVKRLNEVITYGADNQVLQSTVSTVPQAESSVEITTNSKGEQQLTVKVYHEDVKVALSTCLSMYEDGLVEIEMMKARLQAVKDKVETKQRKQNA